MQQTPFLGSKISLTSKFSIRYEGILHEADSSESTITLKKVRSFGTEERQCPQFVPARNEIFEHIVFRANDIKELVVYDTKVANDIDSYYYDPAILSIKSADQQITPPTGTKPEARNNSGNNRRSSNHGRSIPANRRQSHGSNRYHDHHTGYIISTGGNSNNEYQNDFDFETANEQFRSELENLDKGIAELKVENDNNNVGSAQGNGLSLSVLNILNSLGIQPNGNCYNKKSSFFDEISCGTTEAAIQLRFPRPNKINRETFGMVYAPPPPPPPKPIENNREKPKESRGGRPRRRRGGRRRNARK